MLVGRGDVLEQRADHGCVGRGKQLLLLSQTRGVYPSPEPGRDRLHIALDASELTGDEERVALPGLEGRLEAGRGIQERIAVNRAEAQELSMSQGRNHPEHSALLTLSHPGLKPNQV